MANATLRYQEVGAQGLRPFRSSEGRNLSPTPPTPPTPPLPPLPAPSLTRRVCLFRSSLC
jgi:hypothetical protein